MSNNENEKLLTYNEYNEKRNILGEVLPLDMPYSLGIWTTNYCNFKCYYCAHSVEDKSQIGTDMQLKHMDLWKYKKTIDSIKKSGMIKQLVFAGMGEPLLHPDIIEMINYAKEQEVAKQISLITNGSILKKSISDKLVSAGLDNIRISLQGLCSNDYKTVAQVDFDFDNFVENIKYLYENKKQLKVTIKILDVMIEGNKRNKFYEIFESICDELIVDTLRNQHNEIDYTGKGINTEKAWLEGEKLESCICTEPFYRAILSIEAELLSCTHTPFHKCFGDVTEDFHKVWNGRERIEFYLKLLKGERCSMYACKDCDLFLTEIVKSDKLDDYAEILIEKYSKLLEK